MTDYERILTLFEQPFPATDTGRNGLSRSEADFIAKWLLNRSLWYVVRNWFKVHLYADRAQAARMRQHCEYCGTSPVCTDCQRCSNSKCNAGCIYCKERR